jgi:putative addiction module component (TIGR02574 family)
VIVVDFNSVLNGARQLSSEDRLRLIGALWELVPPEANIPLHEDWAAELERRVAAVEAGSAQMVPWTRIRDEALARIGHGNIH